NKVIMRDKLDVLLKNDSVWGEARQNKLDSLKKTIKDNEIKILSEKASGLTKAELKAIAIDTVKIRRELNTLLNQRNSVDSNTAEAIANLAEFNYLISHATVYNNGIYAGKPYFSSYENFVERQNDQDAIDASNKFYELEYNIDNTEAVEEEDTAEVKFL